MANAYDTNVQVVKSVKLPDGTIIQKNLQSMIIRGPQGQTMQMTPAPVWVLPSKQHEKMVFQSKKGHASKIAYGKVLGQFHWSKRYLELDGHTLKWFKKEHDEHPKGVIPLGVGTWIQAADHNTPKRKDAHPATAVGMTHMMTASVAELTSPYHGTVDKDNCFGIHKPNNLNKQLDTMMNASVMSVAFGGTSKKMKENGARTFYFHCDNATERDEWVQALQNNLTAYLSSEECFKDTVGQFCHFLKTYLGAVNPETWDWKVILTELYSE